MRVRLFALFVLLALSPALGAAVFTVTNNDDDGAGSFRQAILDANATPGRDVVEFAAGVSSIILFTSVQITDEVVIDGRSAPLYVAGGPPAIRLYGWDGLVVFAPNVEVHALQLIFDYPLIWSGSYGAIKGCYIGNDGQGGIGSDPEYSDVLVGIRLEGGANGNTVGGTTPSERNIISRCRYAGISVEGYAASPNVISGNFIGTDATGMHAIPNRTGIDIRTGSAGTIVRSNLIAGNATYGVRLEWANATMIGNTIGLSADGSVLSNGTGIHLRGVTTAITTRTTIGGTTASDRNIISGNSVGIDLSTASGVVVQGNSIGTSADGLAARPNFWGIRISGPNNTIGGDDPGAGNLISGNVIGIGLDAGDDVRITGNWIGTNATGTASLPNVTGVALSGWTGVLQRVRVERNVIAGNSSGITIDRTSDAVVTGNLIGTDPTGAIAVGNGTGIIISPEATNIALGGALPGEANTILYNANYGVSIGGPTTTAILGNAIDANGSLGIDYGNDGVTPNDPGDADGVQNHPIVALATSALISGTVSSVASTPFRVELFASPAADPTGFGEGRTLLGFIDVTTDAAGNAAFTLPLPPYPADARVVSSTATRLDAGLKPITTSEFSQALPITPDVSIAGTSQPEGTGGANPFAFAVTLSRPSVVDTAVSYSTTDSTATTAEGDYTMATGTLVIPAGTTTGTIAVNVAGDTNFERDESFTVTLSAPVNATIAVAEATGVIVNDDAPPAISIGDVTQLESGVFTFTVSLSKAIELASSVTMQTADGTATASDDYAAAGPAVLTFAPGTTTQTVTIAVVDDALDETDETFVITLTDPINATLAGAQAVGTIRDDDGAPSILMSDVADTESSGTLTFTLTLSGASALPVSVTAQTADGSAIAGTDYTATGPTVLTFEPGVTSQTFTVPLLDDALAETLETFSVTLRDPINASLGSPQSTGSIEDDDDAPALSIDVAPESAGRTVTFVLTLSGPAGFPVTVDHATVDETAIAGTHYAASAGTLTFAPGVTTQTITIPLLAPASGGDRTFLLRLSNASGATLAEAEARATIRGLSAAVAAPIPTLSPWTLLLLLATLGITGIVIMRRM